MDRIYLDYNATTPLADEVAAAMTGSLLTPFGNPSSLHWAGLPARAAVETARMQIATLLGCEPTEVILTSGGTEANNQVLKGLFFARTESRTPFHIVTSVTEHPAVLQPCAFLERLGAKITRLPVDRQGLADPEEVRRALRPGNQPGTALVSIMHANNETGTIQPVREIASIAHEHGALVHTDAAQTVGKIAVDVNALGVDFLSVAGHKLYGPKGVGALYVRKGIALEPLLHGAGHEAGRRAGTENISQIVGLGAACQTAGAWLNNPSVVELRDHLWQSLTAAIGERVVLNGHPTQRLPNTLNVGFRGWVGSELLAALPHVAASTGSACHAGSVHSSPVLAAMNIAHDAAIGAVRFSLGRHTTRDEIDCVVESIVRIIAK